MPLLETAERKMATGFGFTNTMFTVMVTTVGFILVIDSGCYKVIKEKFATKFQFEKYIKSYSDWRQVDFIYILMWPVSTCKLCLQGKKRFHNTP